MRLRSRVSTALSPVQSLPPEILHQILREAHDPEEERDLIWTSHVCKDWRAVLHSIADLYVRPDWNNWPAWLCREWCQRAVGQPLLLDLSGAGLERVHRYSELPAQLSAILRQFPWRHLNISIEHRQFSSANGHAYQLFNVYGLRDIISLNLESYYDVSLLIKPDLLPNLQQLRLYGAQLDVLENQQFSNVKLLDLYGGLRPMRPGWARILEAVPNLSLLNISPGGSDLSELQNYPMANLRHLRFSEVFAESLNTLFNTICLPGLHSLEIRLSSKHPYYPSYISIVKVSSNFSVSVFFLILKVF